MTYTRGRHTFKVGGALVRRNYSFQLPLYPKGLFIFAPTVVLPQQPTRLERTSLRSRSYLLEHNM